MFCTCSHSDLEWLRLQNIQPFKVFKTLLVVPGTVGILLTLLRMDPVPLTNAQSGAAHARFGPCVVIDDVPGACVASWDITRGAPRPDRPDFPRSPQEARCNQRWRAAHPGCTVHTGSQCLLMAPRSDPGPFRGSIARSDRPIGSTSP
jgi:hypothetical protein